MKKDWKNSLPELLDYLYECAQDGMTGFSSASTLAQSYVSRYSDTQQAVHALIHNEAKKAACLSSLSSLGGILTSSITLPANVVSVLFIQMRMVLAITSMYEREHPLPNIKLLVYGCLCGEGFLFLKNKLPTLMLMKQSTKQYSSSVLSFYLSKAITTMILAHTSKRFIQFIPLVGAVVSGGMDYTFTRSIGGYTHRLFVNNP